MSRLPAAGFKPVVFSPSPSLERLASELSSSLDSLQETLREGVSALAALSSSVPGPMNLLQQLEDFRGKATESLSSPAKFLALTPFQHTVGVRKGEEGFLTCDQALRTLAGRFAEASGGEEALLILIVAAPTQDLLGQALEAFAKVYPIAELEQVRRRAAALARLEKDKFEIPEGRAWPAWSAAAPQRDAKGREAAKALGELLATGEGLAEEAVEPVARLAAFAQKQAGKLLEKAAELQALAESMTGNFDAWTGVYLEGPSLAKSLAELIPPFDHSFKCATLLCWHGTPEQVAYYRESFGL